MLTDKPIRSRPLETPNCRWDDNIRMDLTEIGVNTRNLINSAQDRECLRARLNPKLNLRV